MRAGTSSYVLAFGLASKPISPLSEPSGRSLQAGWGSWMTKMAFHYATKLFGKEFARMEWRTPWLTPVRLKTTTTPAMSGAPALALHCLMPAKSSTS